MAIFPRIQNPCPLKGNRAAYMDGDVCRMCNRQVVDMNGMSDGERVAFMKSCSGPVCVSYKLQVRPALTAAALAAAAIAMPTAAAACDANQSYAVELEGGIHDPHNVEYIKDTSSDSAPVLPVVYEAKAQDHAPTVVATTSH